MEGPETPLHVMSAWTFQTGESRRETLTFRQSFLAFPG